MLSLQLKEGVPVQADFTSQDHQKSFKLRPEFWSNVYVGQGISLIKSSKGYQGSLWIGEKRFKFSGKDSSSLKTTPPKEVKMKTYRWELKNGWAVLRLYDPVIFEVPYQEQVEIKGVLYELRPNGSVKPLRRVK